MFDRYDKPKDGDFFITDWLKNRNTLEFIGIWESIYNPGFNFGEFAIIKNIRRMAAKIAIFEQTRYNRDMIYTIGYAGATIERFVQILKDKRISILIDVRSIPKSQYFYQFNNNLLSKTLEKVDIKYGNWKDEFGARQDNLDFYTDNALDYEKFAQSQQFKDGIAKIKELEKQDRNICLMCAEIDPLNCHRAILCGKEIFANGIDVIHIIAKRNGETYFENQNDFEKRLLKTTKINNLPEAYRKQNKKIGYKLT